MPLGIKLGSLFFGLRLERVRPDGPNIGAINLRDSSSHYIILRAKRKMCLMLVR